jgi:hypothetical protein
VLSPCCPGREKPSISGEVRFLPGPLGEAPGNGSFSVVQAGYAFGQMATEGATRAGPPEADAGRALRADRGRDGAREGLTRLELEFDDGHLRRWSTHDDRNGHEALRVCDARVPALTDLLRTPRGSRGDELSWANRRRRLTVGSLPESRPRTPGDDRRGRSRARASSGRHVRQRDPGTSRSHRRRAAPHPRSDA